MSAARAALADAAHALLVADDALDGSAPSRNVRHAKLEGGEAKEVPADEHTLSSAVAVRGVPPRSQVPPALPI